NACLDAALAELDAVEIRDRVIARGGKHLQLRWAVAGVLRMLVIPQTASDWRSPQNTRRDARRLLRLDGLLESNSSRSAFKPEPDPELWRQQLEELIRRLNQLHVPEQVAAERCEIAAAMQNLLNRTIQQKENGHGA